VDYRPPVEHYLGIPDVEAALGEYPQPLRLAPLEHDAMQAFVYTVQGAVPAPVPLASPRAIW